MPRGTIRLNFDHPIVNFGENLESSASFQVVTAVHSTESINRFDILLKDYLTYSAFDKEDQWVVEKSEEEKGIALSRYLDLSHALNCDFFSFYRKRFFFKED